MITIDVVPYGVPAFESVRAIRYRVFVAEQGVDPGHEFDDIEPRATHFLARYDGTVAGTARLYAEDNAARIGRVAVLPDFRRSGIGRALMDFALDHARRQGFAHAVLHSQTQAAGFYARLGFVPVGAHFEEEGIPHVAMTLTLSGKGCK